MWRRALKRIDTVVPKPLEAYLPPRWLFRRQVIEWTFDPMLRSQLPISYRIFGMYSNLYFGVMPTSSYLPLGRLLLKVSSLVHCIISGNEYGEMKIGDTCVFIDFYDLRFLKVVNEISVGSHAYFMKRFLGEGDTFIDVGANQGAYSIIASELVGESGKVIAFEPQKRLSKAVELSLARLPAKHEVHQIALGDFNGKVELIIPKGYSGTAGLFKRFSGTSSHIVNEVNIRRFDECVDSRDFVGEVFIKLDIEGAEYKFLKGASDVITRQRPKILMEINPPAMNAAGTDPESLRNLLKAMGYSTYVEVDNLSRSYSIDDLSFKNQCDIVVGS